MINYLYDNSFEGFLSCVYKAYYSNIKPDNIISEKNYINDLFSENIVIKTNSFHSSKVFNSLFKKCSFKTAQNTIYAHLSEIKEIENIIYNYIKLSFKYKKNIDNMISNNNVHKTIKTVNKVLFESHRFKGFVRFQKLKNNIYYSSIEPDFNILSLIAPHFSKRFSSQNWIIHDIKRNSAIFYDNSLKKYEFVDIELLDELKNIKEYFDKSELNFQSLWKTYFKNISINERKNPKLQQQFMPKKYWKYLIEKE